MSEDDDNTQFPTDGLPLSPMDDCSPIFIEQWAVMSRASRSLTALLAEEPFSAESARQSLLLLERRFSAWNTLLMHYIGANSSAIHTLQTNGPIEGDES